ncbi:hypothetical protein FRC17_010117 [Serendipita sp. 399]|nr:hypothetical protein FRC17_010117 [Serendipita sp. 399]
MLPPGQPDQNATAPNEEAPSGDPAIEDNAEMQDSSQDGADQEEQVDWTNGEDEDPNNTASTEQPPLFDQIAKLCKADWKKAMGMVLKQMRPIIAAMSKALKENKQNSETAQATAKKDEIMKAKVMMNKADKEYQKINKSVEYREDGLRKAEARLQKVPTPLQWLKET